MTAVAYRNRIMAADSMSVVGDEVKVAGDVKVANYRGHLLGASGDLCPTMKELLAWFFDTGGLKPYPRKADFTLMVATRTSLALYTKRGDCEPINSPFFAIGSGAHLALGRMDGGGTAFQAIKTAIKWGPGIGGKIITRRLK